MYIGFCEIQEANIIKRASVLEALNPLLAGGGKDNFIKLPTGEVITRHPDCVIAFTVNREYEGCNDLQEAVYSRINLIKQIGEGLRFSPIFLCFFHGRSSLIRVYNIKYSYKVNFGAT